MRLQTLCKVAGIFLVCLVMAATASAQYGGGGTMGGGTGGTAGTGTGNMPRYSSGSGVAIGAGVAAGAAVGIALLVHHRHKPAPSEALLIGCTRLASDGISLENENDGETYRIASGGHLQAGKRVELMGVVTNDRSGAPAFRVHNVVNDYGECSPTLRAEDLQKNDAGATAK